MKFSFTLTNTEKNRFFKIARYCCMGLWGLTLVKMFTDPELVLPLMIFSSLIVALTILIPDGHL